MTTNITVSKWKYAKEWVYSVTYDEALYELHKFVIPHHEEFGIPGHVEVVSGHIGMIRQIGSSSYNGFRHMSGAELRELLSYGWGAGCHSWSHGDVAADFELELLKARETLEDAVGQPITVYTAPGSNVNLKPDIAEKAKEYGYLAGMGIFDQLNRADSDTEDLFLLQRPPLHEKFSDLYESEFDAYKRITQAKKSNGWIIDYLHCPLETAAHDFKDCTAAHHFERLKAVAEEGKYDCWFANPDDAVDYRYMRRHVSFENLGGDIYKLSLYGLPDRVKNRELTFVVTSARYMNIEYNGTKIYTWRLDPAHYAFNCPVKNGDMIKICLSQGGISI